MKIYKCVRINFLTYAEDPIIGNLYIKLYDSQGYMNKDCSFYKNLFTNSSNHFYDYEFEELDETPLDRLMIEMKGN